jgi:signal-transduction protein with cAMP-binding, CBS, and nucleotidyltransferase domain
MDELGNYMNGSILSIDHESSAQEAAQYMQANHIGSLLVKKFDEFVGIVTDTDLTRKVLGPGLNPDTTEIHEIMTSPLLTMDRFLPIDQANEFMRKNKIRHLVVTESEKIVGVISVRDLVAYYAQSFRMTE